MAEDGEECAVDTNRGLNDVWCIVLVKLAVEILQLLTAELAMTRKVEVGA